MRLKKICVKFLVIISRDVMEDMRKTDASEEKKTPSSPSKPKEEDPLITNEERIMVFHDAINAYQFQIGRYQTFMNYFALFNGALLVAFCTLLTSTTAITNTPNTCCGICFENKYILSNQYHPLLVMIAVLGIIVSLIWERSICGNIAWMDSWMKIIRKYEFQKIYSTIISDKFANKQETHVIKDFYSTQKLTRVFVFSIVFAWLTALIYIALDMFNLYNNYYSIAIFIVCIVCIVTLFTLLYFKIPTNWSDKKCIRKFYYDGACFFLSNINDMEKLEK